MKRILYILVAATALGSLFSCEPVEDRNSLPAITLTPETLKFSVVQNPQENNKVTLTNLDSKVIPYWSFSNSTGELGHYNTNEQAIFLPFAGNYVFNFTAYTPGGAVYANPVNIKVDHNDSSYFSDPKWNLLTNGAAGKTWIIIRSAPVEFVSSDYVNSTVSAAGWYPNLSDIGWAGIEDKDWGEVTFDLNGGYNVTVKQTSLTTGSTAQKITKSTYNYTRTADFTNDRIAFNGGAEMLHPGPENSWSPSFTFSDIRLVELTATTLSYTAVRNDGQLLVYHLMAKPTN